MAHPQKYTKMTILEWLKQHKAVHESSFREIDGTRYIQFYTISAEYSLLNSGRLGGKGVVGVVQLLVNGDDQHCFVLQQLEGGVTWRECPSVYNLDLLFGSGVVRCREIDSDVWGAKGAINFVSEILYWEGISEGSELVRDDGRYKVYKSGNKLYLVDGVETVPRV